MSQTSPFGRMGVRLLGTAGFGSSPCPQQRPGLGRITADTAKARIRRSLPAANLHPHVANGSLAPDCVGGGEGFLVACGRLLPCGLRFSQGRTLPATSCRILSALPRTIAPAVIRRFSIVCRAGTCLTWRWPRGRRPGRVRGSGSCGNRSRS